MGKLHVSADSGLEYLNIFNRLCKGLTSDYKQNIDTIVKFTNTILGGVCSLYNKLELRDQSLICFAKVNAPADLPEKDEARGHICYEATIRGQNKIIKISDISKTEYQTSDPYVKKYKLKSYLGCPVKIESVSLGSLCIVDNIVREFSDYEVKIIEHLAEMIRLQEEKLKTEKIQTLLYKISRTLMTSRTMTELCSQVKEHLKTLFVRSDFSLTIFSNNGNRSQFSSHSQQNGTDEIDRFFNETIKIRKTPILLNKNEIQALLPACHKKTNRWNSWMGVPLKIEDEMTGVLSLKNRSQQIFLPEDLEMLEFISYEIARVIRQKNLEENLKIKEEEYRTIFEHTSVGIYRIDLAGNILVANDSLVRILGYESAKSLIGKNFHKNFRLEFDIKFFISLLKKQGEIKNRNGYLLTKEREKVYTHETAKLIKYNNITIIEGTVEDITNEILIKEANENSLEKFNSFISTVPVGVLQTDQKGNILYQNENVKTITGYSPNEIQTIKQLSDILMNKSKKPIENTNNSVTTIIIKTKKNQLKFIKFFKSTRKQGGNLIVLDDITPFIENKQDLLIQTRYLSAINKISDILITVRQIPYNKLLKIIGDTLDADQVNFYRSFEFSDRFEFQSLSQWSKYQKPINSDDTKEIFYKCQDYFPAWRRQFQKSDFLFGNRDSFSKKEKIYMDQNGIGSIFIHKIKINGKLYGFLTIKSKDKNKIWNNREVILIDTFINNLTETIGQQLAHSQLISSKTSYMELFRNNVAGIIIFDVKGIIKDINPTAEKLFNKKYDEVLHHPLTSLIDDEEVIDHISTAIKFCNSVDSSKKIDIIMGEEESLKAVNLLFQKIHYFEQNCIIMYAYDITAQYKKEYEIRKNLHEKQTLLEEIHHRVKNNLQIISSLLNFQMKDIETERDRALFLDSQNRIKSIALIHESLYSSGNLSQIDFRQYTEKLINRLFTIFKVDGNRIKYKIDVKNFEITIKKAIPCGLILDELITNSLKYAFPNERKGAITISLKRRDHHFCICVKDNGIGFDMHALQKKNKIRGLDLISIMTKQLNGECRFTDQKGFGCEIQFTE